MLNAILQKKKKQSKTRKYFVSILKVSGNGIK